MAERRMFAKTIIDSDAFLDMPLSAQALYFHLGMRADDDGFINNPKRIQRAIGANDDDFKLLIAKRFVITFESGVIVIKHWKIHNYIQSDRYKPTPYQEEKKRLIIKENSAYTECIHDVYKTDTQVRLELVKDSIGEDSNILSSEPASVSDKQIKNPENKKPKQQKQEAEFEHTSKQYKSAKWLEKRVIERYPVRKPLDEKHRQMWARDIDLLNRIDGQSWEDISDVLTFSQKDTFWQTVILSTKNFRKQYVAIYAKMKEAERKDDRPAE